MEKSIYFINWVFNLSGIAGGGKWEQVRNRLGGGGGKGSIIGSRWGGSGRRWEHYEEQVRERRYEQVGEVGSDEKGREICSKLFQMDPNNCFKKTNREFYPLTLNRKISGFDYLNIAITTHY